MTRISLTEDYDDRNVISKLKNMNNKLDSTLAQTEEAVESAQRSAESAHTASESAMQSVLTSIRAEAMARQAQATANAMDSRITDTRNYAEAIGDDVSAIDTEIHTTRPYVDTNTEQTITAKKHIPTATANDSSDVWVNKAFVQANGANKPNNLVHDIGDEVIYGVKTFDSNVLAYIGCLHTPSIAVENEYTAVLEIPVSHRSIDIELFTSGARGGRALLHIDTQDANDNNAYYLYRKGQNLLSTLNYNDAVVLTVESDKITVWLKYRSYSIVQFWVSMYIQYEIIKYDAQLNYLTDQVHMSLESLHDNYNRILYPE